MPRRILMIGLCVTLASPIAAHPPQDSYQQMVVLDAWADAFVSRDGQTVANLDNSSAISAAFVGDATHVVTRYATFTSDDTGVMASPVVIFIDSGTFRLVVDVHLVQDNDKWRISTVTPSRSPMPEALVHTNLPEHVSLQQVEFSVTDVDRNKPAHSRVRIVDQNGEYWPPDGHQKHIRTGWREDVGGDVMIDGKTWAYVRPSFNARLPTGDYSIEVTKGHEYRKVSKRFSVGVDDERKVSIPIERWSDLNAQGWYAGDTHTHFLPDQSALLELRAEDLSVIYVLATKWGQLITDVDRFTGGPSAHSSPTELVVFNEETRHGWLGHTILHGIKELVYPLTWGGPSEGVIGGYDYPAMAHQADRAHQAGGLVTWAHFPGPGGELAVDIALQKIDTVDLFTWGDAFAPRPQLDGSVLPSGLDTWYLFLNTSSRLPATAGTDKMLNTQVSGSVRTWAYVGEQFSYQGWLDALKKGRTFVSTGPVLKFTANGSPIGSDLKLSAGDTVLLEASLQSPYDKYPIEQLEIVVGGEVIVSVVNEKRDSKLSARAEITADASTWVAARANGSEIMPLQAWSLLGTSGIPPMAHTSPIYLTVDGQPIWSAAAATVLEKEVQRAVDWATNTANYLNEAQRAEIIKLYKSALDVYKQ